MVAAPVQSSAGEDRPVGVAIGKGGRGAGWAGPGAGLSLLVKKQQLCQRRGERQAACSPTGPGADPGAVGKQTVGQGLARGKGVGGPEM